jgi:pimeloyl-[acyl-carrier protein] methyl ester esterase
VRGEGWPHGVDAAVFRGFAAELRRDYARTIERFMALEVLGDDAAREELRFLRATMASKPPGDPAALDAGLRWLEQRDDRNRLAGLAVPSLWLAGTRDRLVPPAAMRWAAQACDGVYREWACGHAPFLSHADDVAQMLKTWR